MKQKNKIVKIELETSTYEYIQALEACDSFYKTKETVEQKKPVAEEIYDNVEEYNAYISACENYDAITNEWNKKYSELNTRLQEAEGKLFKMLPRNIWIGTTYCNTPLWIGCSTTNWGGGTAAIVTSKKKPTDRLKHVDYD